MHKFVRIGVKPLAKTAITPNQITTLRLISGLGAALLFSIGQEGYTIVGSGIFILSLLLDRADGILARLTGKTSKFGHKYDLIADTISNAMSFVGIGAGLRHGQLDDLAIILGFVAGLSVATVFFLVIRIEALQGDRSAEIKSTAGFDPDDGMLIVPVALLLGFGNELIISAAIGAPIFGIFFFMKFRYLLRT